MDIQSQFLNAQRKNSRAEQNEKKAKNDTTVGTVTKRTSEISLEDGTKARPSQRNRRPGSSFKSSHRVPDLTDLPPAAGGAKADRSNTRDPEFVRGETRPAAKTLFDHRRDSIGRTPLNQSPQTPPTRKSKERRSRQTTTHHPQKPIVQEPQPRIADDSVPPPDTDADELEHDIKPEQNVIPFKQLDVPQIQPDQLIREAKSIYAAMLMVENKCNEVDRQEDAKVRSGKIQHIPETRYKELVVLHRTLLYEQYDFFLACSHPAATPQLKLLPHKYGMPGRIWKSGIHTFLEVLRHHLPESLEHMLTFLHMAYGVVCLLYETIPSHKATWIECLGDLARYRMAIEEKDAEIRDIWTDKAREWYYSATDIFPSVGRLYHHLAIVARQNPIEQLYLYVKSLTVDLIFTGTRESVLILFQTVSKETPGAGLVTNVDYLFVHLHQLLFTKVDLDRVPMKINAFISLLQRALEYSSDPETPEFWNNRAIHIAICNIGSLYQYGAREGIFRSFIEKQSDTANQTASSPTQLSPPLSRPPPPPPALEYAEPSLDEPQVSQQFILARDLAMHTLRAFLSCNIDNAKVLHVQAWMIFIEFFIRHRKGIMENFLEAEIPWQQLVDYINLVVKQTPAYKLDFSAEPVFPEITGASATADDYALRALVWASDFHPRDYFSNHPPESDRSFEHPTGTAGAAANANLRKERVLYLAARICVAGGYFKFDETSRQFELDQALQTRIDEHAAKAASADTPVTPVTPLTDSASFSDAGYDTGVFEFQRPNPSVELPGHDSGDLQSAPDHIKALLQHKQELASRLNQLKADEREPDSQSVVFEAGPSKSVSEIRKKHTMVVVDTNLLLSNLSMFIHILKSGEWVVIVPNPVVIELLGISRNEDSKLGQQAKQALVAINDAATNNNPNLRIITSRGNRIQQPGFYRENISNFKAGLEGGIDDVIISITARLVQTQGESQNEGALPAVLLTNDNNMRLMAKAHGVHAVSGDDWSKQFGPRVDKRAEKRKLPGAQPHSSPRSPRRKSSENASYTVQRSLHEG